jgi:hypothetical protein
MTNLAELPSDVLQCIFGYLDVLDLEIQLKSIGSKQLWAKIVHEGRSLAITIESLRGSVRMPFMRLTNYASLFRLQITLFRDLFSQDPIWVRCLPKTLREIDWSFPAAQHVFIRPLSPTSDDRLTHFIYSNRGYTTLSVKDTFPNLTLLHIQTSNARSCGFYMPSPSPSPIPFDETWSDFIYIYYNDYMCLRFIEELPPTITSLRLDFVLSAAQQLVQRYSPVQASESTLPVSGNHCQSIRYPCPIDEKSFTENLPSIAKWLPSVIHFHHRPDTELYNYGSGSLAFFQQLNSVRWGDSFFETGAPIFSSSTNLQRLSLERDTLAHDGGMLPFPPNLTELHMYKKPYSRNTHSDSDTPLDPVRPILPFHITSLKMESFFGALKASPLVLPSKLTELNFFNNSLDGDLLNLLPNSLQSLAIFVIHLDINLELLPRGLKRLKLRHSLPLNEAKFNTLPKGLLHLILHQCDVALRFPMLVALPELSKLHLDNFNVPLSPSDFPYLPRHLDILLIPSHTHFRDEFLPLLPSGLKQFQTTILTTNGSFVDRNLKRFSLATLTNGIRQLLPQNLRGRTYVNNLACHDTWSSSMDQLPPTLTKIDFRHTMLNMSSLSFTSLPSLVNLTVSSYGFNLQSISTNLTKLRVLNDSRKEGPVLISALPRLEYLELNATWPEKCKLPVTLTYLKVYALERSTSSVQLQELVKLKTFVRRGQQAIFDSTFVAPSLTSIDLNASRATYAIRWDMKTATHLKELQTARCKTTSLCFNDCMILPRSIQYVAPRKIVVNSKEVFPLLDKASWDSFEQMEDLNDPLFVNAIFRAIFPNGIVWKKTELELSMSPSDFHVIPRKVKKISKLYISESLYPAKRRWGFIFSQLPPNLTFLDLNCTSDIPHSIARHLPRTLTYLRLSVPAFNEAAYLDLPRTLKSLHFCARPKILPKYVRAFPPNLEALSMAEAILSKEILTNLPRTLTAFSFQNSHHLTLTDLLLLPQGITRLVMPSYFLAANSYSYLPPNIVHLLPDDPHQDSKKLAFEESRVLNTQR